MGRVFRDIDWVTLFLLFFLSLFGLFTLLSLGSPLFVQQLVFVVVGFLLLVAISRIDGVFFIYLAPYLYAFAVAMLAVTHLSPEIRGASRWIFLGPIQIQPSELLKPIFLLFFATTITRYSPRQIRFFPLHALLFLIPFFLIFKQPDLGTAIVYGVFWSSMMFVGGISLWFIAVLAGVGIAIVPFAWNMLEPFQQLRILTFLNPSFDPKGVGYNALQAMISVGSGQLFGRGLGKGTQSHLQFLPEYHTDFIFATIIEELGFVGGVALFALYGIVLWRIIRPFMRPSQHDDLLFLYSFGLFSIICVQLVVNAGMNMGIIPITGITLPFVSYGGSSFISLCVGIGILWSLRRTRQIRII